MLALAQSNSQLIASYDIYCYAVCQQLLLTQVTKPYCLEFNITYKWEVCVEYFNANSKQDQRRTGRLLLLLYSSPCESPRFAFEIR